MLTKAVEQPRNQWRIPVEAVDQLIVFWLLLDSWRSMYVRPYIIPPFRFRKIRRIFPKRKLVIMSEGCFVKTRSKKVVEITDSTLNRN